MANTGAGMVTLKIPRPLYERLGQLIEGTGFRSVTEFATYVLRDLASQPPSAKASAFAKASADKSGGKPLTRRLTRAELAAARKRLQELGYL